jgi:acetyltransferase-like isoleucine patch superfamily enzyme
VAGALNKLGLPGAQFLTGEYLYLRGATVFPKSLRVRNLSVPDDMEFHGTLFNIQDSVTIEAGVVLGHEVAFLTGLHPVGPDGVEKHGSVRGPIVVKRGAWIASRATILGGVTVGSGSAVAAGAVVTKDVPDWELWGGVPARRIRSTRPETPEAD